MFICILTYIHVGGYLNEHIYSIICIPLLCGYKSSTCTGGRIPQNRSGEDKVSPKDEFQTAAW